MAYDNDKLISACRIRIHRMPCCNHLVGFVERLFVGCIGLHLLHVLFFNLNSSSAPQSLFVKRFAVVKALLHSPPCSSSTAAMVSFMAVLCMLVIR